MKIREIAKALSLCNSTVSKAINNATDVSEETRNLVLDFLIAKGGTVKKKIPPQKRLCALLENIGTDNKYISYEVLDGFRRAANVYNYDIVIKNIPHSDFSFKYDECITQNNFLGAFIMGINLNSPLIKQIDQSKVPTVVMDNVFMNPFVSSINVDNINSVFAVVKHLHNNGHKKIALLSGEEHSQVSRERFGGYVAGLLAAKISYDESLVFFGSYKEDCCLPFIEKIIDSKCTAVVCASDLIAIGLIKELKSKGLLVPDDISVTGFDNLLLSEFFTPPLTTISYNLSALGQNAFNMLRQIIKGGAATRTTIYGALIDRSSVLNITGE